jgi:hypothetical protein
VTLDDGTKFRPKDSGLRMMRSHIKLHRDLEREPELSDFPEEDREEWRNYAKWSPEPGKHGQIIRMVSEMAKKLRGIT